MRPDSVPLCVDLDGTLLKTDTFYELLLRAIKESIWVVFCLPFILIRGKQYLKQFLSERSVLNPSLLPYNEEFLAFLKKQHHSGRKLVLVTGCYKKTAREIADYLGLFAEVFATDLTVNLTGKNKADHLVEKFGSGGFDYAGNDAIDISVWQQCREKILVNSSEGFRIRLQKRFTFAAVFDQRNEVIKPLVKAVRLHQWAKNGLIFIPALTAQCLFSGNHFFVLMLAFLAFGCCASFSYIVNDLLDLDADRKHHTKRYRPLAAGILPISTSIFVAILLLVLTIFLAPQLNGGFVLLLLSYFLITNLYSFKLKSIPVLDVAILAGLYTLRVLAGAVAINLEATFWLIAFSAFLFFSLAIVKRLSELLYLRDNSDEPVEARGYVAEDVSTLQALGAAAAMAAVLVLALYIDSQTVKALYSSPRHLWLLCPVLLVWLGRVWLITGRGKMHDDPVVFALKDRVSWFIFAIGAGVFFSATFF